jgi:class 3 adenylate cyclase
VTRLRTRELVFLSGVLGVFGLCLLLHLDRMMRGEMAWIPTYVHAAESESGHPRVRGFWTGPDEDAPGLAVGDRVLAIGDADARGLGRLGFVARVYEQAAGGLTVPVRYARGDEIGSAVLHLSPIPYPWRKTIVALALVTVGALLFWRLRGGLTARLFLLATAGYALNWTDFWGGPPAQTYAAIAAFGLGMAVALPLTLRLTLLVPDELARHDRVARLAPWAFAIVAVALTSWAFATPFSPSVGMPLNHATTVVWIATMLVVLASRYRRASAPGRRQIKWVLLGFYVGLVPALIGSVLTLAEPRLWWLYQAGLATAIAIPVGLAIALARHNLFDVDRLITAAASYTVLSVLFLAGLLGLAPRIATVSAGVMDPTIVQTGLSLGVAALVFAGKRQIEGRIGHWLFPERRGLEQEAQQLRSDLGRCSKPSELLTLLGERLQALLRLATAAIYARTDGALVPVFAHGRAIAPALDPDGTLVQWLATRREAVRVVELGRDDVAPAERAALEAMGVEVVLPLFVGRELEGVVCLGEKGSGDVFTATDRALLETIVDRAADALERFGDAERQRQEREMHERLRRYVPGTLAEEITSGADLEPEEREVTVLFVDIRGYSSYAQSLGASEIFSTVNRYTEAVSAAVRSGGGTVVEFNGDGMMAVFGAPRPLPAKESAAVETAQRIGAAVDALELGNGSGRRLSVGVGIATGPAFVGNIQAVDRLIWSAIGNTTNLAARLQALTREIGAAIAVDRATWTAAGREACAGFVKRPRVAIRGRDEPVDVYALPVEEVA